MEYRWNPEQMAEVFVLPAAVADRHIRLAGPTQLKVLLWLARSGRGSFDAAACSAAIGYSPADCADAVQYLSLIHICGGPHRPWGESIDPG